MSASNTTPRGGALRPYASDVPVDNPIELLRAISQRVVATHGEGPKNKQMK